MMIVTGGSGFIGSNLVRSLRSDGIEVVVVDDVDPSTNLAGVDVLDHLGQEEFRARLLADAEGLRGVEAVLHQGACSSTTETDEDFLRRNNLEYSTVLLDACSAAGVPLIYASSASVYGTGAAADDAPAEELSPLNGYARSKATFDAVVQARSNLRSQVVGLRYFNVYGPGETLKGPMASMVHQAARQIVDGDVVRIFGAGGGAAAGEHRRDFVSVFDIVAVIRWFLAHSNAAGIYNVGTGTSRSFQDLADIVVACHGSGRVDHIDFPPWLEGRYQADTRADLTRLRAAGCDHVFLDLETGIRACLDHERGPWAP